MLYLTELLQDALEYEAARQQATRGRARRPAARRASCAASCGPTSMSLPPEDLAQLLILGLARDEFRGGRGAVFGLLDAWDYLIDPLPNLVFARDTSVWIGDSVAVTSPRGRRAEAEIAAIIFAHHPQFAGTKRLYEPGLERLAGGDVLLLAPGVLAIGTGGQTSPAGMERLARRVFETGFAHTVLAVLTEAPGVTQPGGACLDTLCTVVGPDTVMMRPAVAYSLVARTHHASAGRACGSLIRGRSWRPPRRPWASTGCASSRPARPGRRRGRHRRSPDALVRRPVGRRLQPARAGPGHGAVLRAERADQRAARGRGHRGDQGSRR